jgi:hypothetical protein
MSFRREISGADPKNPNKATETLASGPARDPENDDNENLRTAETLGSVHASERDRVLARNAESDATAEKLIRKLYSRHPERSMDWLRKQTGQRAAAIRRVLGKKWTSGIGWEEMP